MVPQWRGRYSQTNVLENRQLEYDSVLCALDVTGSWIGLQGNIPGGSISSVHYTASFEGRMSHVLRLFHVHTMDS